MSTSSRRRPSCFSFAICTRRIASGNSQFTATDADSQPQIARRARAARGGGAQGGKGPFSRESFPPKCGFTKVVPGRAPNARMPLPARPVSPTSTNYARVRGKGGESAPHSRGIGARPRNWGKARENAKLVPEGRRHALQQQRPSPCPHPTPTWCILAPMRALVGVGRPPASLVRRASLRTPRSSLPRPRLTFSGKMNSSLSSVASSRNLRISSVNWFCRSRPPSP